MDKELLEIFIGKKAAYYLNKWEKTAKPSLALSWNLWAFLGGVFWLLYRKMYLYSLFFIILNIANSLLFGSIYISLALALVMGFFGNSLYYRHATEKVKNLMEPDEIKKAGGVHAFWLWIFIFLLALIPITIFLQYMFIRSLIYPEGIFSDMNFSSPPRITTPADLNDNGKPAFNPDLKFGGKLYFAAHNTIYASDFSKKGKHEVISFPNAEYVVIYGYNQQKNMFLLCKRENHSDELLLYGNGKQSSLFRTPAAANGQPTQVISCAYLSPDTKDVFFNMEDQNDSAGLHGYIYKVDTITKELKPITPFKGSVQQILYFKKGNQLIINTYLDKPTDKNMIDSIIYSYDLGTQRIKEIARGYDPQFFKGQDAFLYTKEGSLKLLKYDIQKAKEEEINIDVTNFNKLIYSPDQNYIIGLTDGIEDSAEESQIININANESEDFNVEQQLNFFLTDINSNGIVWGK